MQYLNYCENLIKFLTIEVRKAVQTINRKGKSNPIWTKESKRSINRWNKHIELLKESTKFILPLNGNIIIDPSLSHIVGTRLELPYKKIVLEIPVSENMDVPIVLTKNIVLILIDDGDVIIIQSFSRDVSSQKWTMSYQVIIHKDSDIVIRNDKFYIDNVAHHQDASRKEIDILLKLCLHFLNSLAAPSVKVEKRCSPMSQKKYKKTSSNSRIQEDYHYVFIDIPKKIYENNTAKSDSNVTPPEERFRPCEHERQGHWRHFKNGTKTWINTQTINSGVGKKLEKKYVIRVTKQTKHTIV